MSPEHWRLPISHPGHQDSEMEANRDWTDARSALITLRSLVRSERLDQGLAALDAGDEELFVERIASGEAWNHMVSLFDRVFKDPEREELFVQAQLQLADSRQQRGVATDDVVHHAMLLRGEAPPGWTVIR